MKLIAHAIILLLLALLVPAQEPSPEPYRSWNVCVETFKQEGDFETGLRPKLRESYVTDPPEHMKSLDRAALIRELIDLHKRRLEALERMLKAEGR